MLTGLQIRMARSALRWSGQELARRADMALKTIQRLEAVDGIPPSHSATLTELRSIFEAAGIEFIGTPDDGPGIRIHAQPNHDA